MKKILGLIFTLIILGCGGYFVYINYIKDKVPKLVLEEEISTIDKYYIYGNHFNIEGNINIKDKNYDKLSLALYNGEDKDIEITSDTDGTAIKYYISNLINEGLYLDNLDIGTYYLVLKATYPNTEEQEKPIIKYYALKNNTKYKETKYYTLSKYNNIITINSNNEYNTLQFIVEKNKKDKNYDVTIDPGHGGMDGGGAYGDYKETDFTMDISKKIQKQLEAEGITVKLTHDEGDLDKNHTMDEYNTHGRAVIPNEVKSKYTFSIHINKNSSTKVKGIEVYTAANINYDLAKDIVNNITTNTSLATSTNRTYKMYDGIYTHNFSESEINDSLAGYEKKGYKAYNVTTDSNYLYMIRETGGIMTGAYIDDSNPDKVGTNPYYDSNIGNESYLLELGYISNTNDVKILNEEQEALAKAIATSIIKEIKEKV